MKQNMEKYYTWVDVQFLILVISILFLMFLAILILFLVSCLIILYVVTCFIASSSILIVRYAHWKSVMLAKQQNGKTFWSSQQNSKLAKKLVK